MRKKNDQSLGEVIQEFLNKHNLQDGVMEIKILDYYNKLMGPAIINRTEYVNFRNGNLNIKIKSASLRQELTHSKDKIKNMLNKALEAEIIKNVNLH